jgi:hypothetical protein
MTVPAWQQHGSCSLASRSTRLKPHADLDGISTSGILRFFD